ncbi:hypothetical protein RYH80_00410 [Halobaculum sp. MBLA0147]|uniref:DUF7562 family protein n=1 Tax=Halobaculum sp. MBLA0147 TaxID=3079934 RepID=UPI003523B79A
MFGSGRDQADDDVFCIACGERVPRGDAREYDKEGDRWNRHGKEFEFLCVDCHGELCHQPRDELEAVLCDVEAVTPDAASSETFAAAYQREVLDRYGDPETERRDADTDTDRDSRR